MSASTTPAAASVIFATTLTAYLLTMPGQITLEDAGLFQMVCHQGGIGHPPGYPLFVLACQGFVSLPFFDDSVFAANLLSSIFASLTCVVVYLIGKMLFAAPSSALALAYCYGFSTVVWSQAIIVEVYSLQSLLFAGASYADYDLTARFVDNSPTIQCVKQGRGCEPTTISVEFKNNGPDVSKSTTVSLNQYNGRRASGYAGHPDGSTNGR